MRYVRTLLGIALACGVGCAQTREVPREDGGAQLPDAATPDAGNGDGSTDVDAAVRDAGSGSCEPPELHREPGEPLFELGVKGSEACADTTLGAVIDAVHAAQPELDDIRELYVPDPERGGDQSFIYAFATRQGGFALVFRRGAGDCPAGCTENWYYYFRTDESCEPQAVGSFVPSYESGCIAVEGFPLWDHPPPPDPLSVCGAPDEVPLAPSGVRRELACGERTPCSTKGGTDVPVVALDFELQFVVEQDVSDPSHGTLTLLNTGHPDLDGRALDASIERRRVHVVEQVDNLPATCLEQHELEVVLDFEGYSGSFVHYFEVKTPDCASAPGDICKGGLELELGNLATRACVPEIELGALVGREQALHSACEQDADCALLAVDAGCITNCPTAVSADYAPTLERLIEQAGEAYCADSDCSSVSSCATVEAACDDGRCTVRRAL